MITVVLGTLFAVLFDREFFGKNVATLLVIAPFFVMPTVSALIWKNMMMHPVYGFFAVIMNKLGLPADRLVQHAPALIHHHHCVLGVAALCLSDFVYLDQESGPGAEGGGGSGWRQSGAVLLLCDALAFEPSDWGRSDDRDDFSALDLRGDLHDDLGRTGNGDNEPGVFGVCVGLQQFDAGIASAGGILAVVLANIVAYFMVKLVAKNLQSR